MMLRIRLFFFQLLNVELVCVVVAAARWLVYARLLGRLRVLQAEGMAEETVRHNLRSIRNFAVHRSLCLIRPLVAAVSVARAGRPIERRDFPDERVLSIGPRSEGELLNLVAHGFRPANIRGLDLIGYSPWVDLGDMHAMPYADDAWDVVVCGWVLAYSDRKAEAAREIVRVAKPGALIAVGVEYSGLSNEQVLARGGYLPGSAERIRSVGEIEALFEGHIEQVHFRHDIVEARRDEDTVALVLVFSTRK